jgi:predicted DNA-binding transcriptional regulator AlpA
VSLLTTPGDTIETMAKKNDPPPVMQLAELAEYFGVSKRAAWKRSRRADFPEPYADLSAGKVWKRSQIDRWMAKHLPLPAGRPPTKRRKS